jgi:adenylyltransferase/sulfurtransferase
MTPDQIRYSCQIALPGFTEAGQALLKNARVLIAGVGGLGCPAAQYLASSGIGTLGLLDFDTVSISNLHRQVLYTPEDTGKKKVSVAARQLQKQNPGIKIIPHDVRITSENAFDIISHYDIIVDGTDNFDTRYLLNDAAVILGKPLVYGAIYQYEGQLAVWNVENESGLRSPNYRDIFPNVDATQIPNCAEGGVIPTLAGIIGCMQANEVIKYITKTGDLIAGKILVLDSQTMQSRIIKIGAVSLTHINRLTPTVLLPSVSVRELKNDLNSNAIRLIDIRSEAEHEEFNIGGEHIPMEDLFANLEDIDRHTKTILYCASGKRSGEMVKLIKKRFPDANFFSLEGGLKKWLEEE